MSTDRATVRKQFAKLLQDNLVGTGLPMQAVYDYQVGDFEGKSPVLVVTGSGTKRGSTVVYEPSIFYLDVHSFVLYSAEPVTATNDPAAGSDVVINLVDTPIFAVGNVVTIEDDSYRETAEVTASVSGVSITVGTLAHSYTKPKVYIWTESQSEDLIDLTEKIVHDTAVQANEEDVWLEVEEGDRSIVDVVEVGGSPYRHETIEVVITTGDT